MKKNLVREIVLAALALAVFLVLALVIPFEHTKLYWTAFAFSLFAVLMQIVTIGLAFHKGETYKSKFYGFPIARLGVIYLIVQMLLGFLGMALGDRVPLWCGALCYVLLFAAFVVGLVGADAARDFVEAQDEKVKVAQGSMLLLQSKAAALAGACDDAETKTYLQKLAEDFRFSDPMSSDATSAQELQLSVLLDELQTAITAGDFAAARKTILQTQTALQTRNELCKRSK